jgi:triosephosphate isomerase
VENAAHAKRRQLIVGNWKLNGSRQVNAELMAGILAGWQN